MAGFSDKHPRVLPLRSALILLCVLVIWIVIIARLFSMQVIDYESYLDHAVDNIQHTTTVSGNRGIIYDRNGIQLASNYSVYRVFISPYDMVDRSSPDQLPETPLPDEKTVELVATGLADILGVDKAYVMEQCLRTNKKDLTMARNIESDKADELLDYITKHSLSRALLLEASYKRYYPNGTLASHVIGVTGTDGGLIGLEMQYDDYLSASSVKYLSAKDSLGLNMPFKYDSYIDASGGANLVTTLDANIQRILEKQLEATYNDSSPLNRVTAIAMDPNTGAVYGMATYPNFNLNQPYELTDEFQAKLDATGYPETFIVPTDVEKSLNLSKYETIEEKYNAYYYHLVYSMWKNKAVSELYEPGSTFKIITTATALEEQAATLSSHFYCPGYHVVEGYEKPIRCHKREGHGDLDFASALQDSCNPAMMMMSASLGRQVFYQYFKAFGYTEKTGIDLPGEASSVYHAYADFNQTELAVYSFGQTFKVTPIRQLTSICAIANGGTIITPYLVEQIVSSSGSVLYAHKTQQIRQVMSSGVCETISTILEGGVSGDGGAKNAYVPGYKIAAKTGTSEIRDIIAAEGDTMDYRVGSTVAYAPADDPKIAIILIVDMPTCDSKYGSQVAAPYVANIMNEVLPYLGVERVYTEEELKKLAIEVPNVKGWLVEDAAQEIKDDKLQVEIVGDGTQVLYQMPAAGSKVDQSSGKVILYTGDAIPEKDVKVLNVVGLTAQKAMEVLVNAGLNVCLVGPDNGSAGAQITEQDTPMDTMVPRGTVITLTLRYTDGTAN